MPRGQPDYGLYTQTPVASGISDPGEAAARLGGINVYDRRGWTVWMDDFEAPALRWGTAIVAPGSIPVLSTTRAWMGIQSVYLAVPAVNGARSAINRTFPLVRLGRIGIELFTYLNVTTPSYLMILLTIYDGSNESYAELHLDNLARTATLITSIGPIPVATKCFPLVPLIAFIPVKLVVDMDTDRYVRLLIGPDEIDLSTYLMVLGPATDVKMLGLTCWLEGNVAGVSNGYIDNFILTQNEP